MSCRIITSGDVTIIACGRGRQERRRCDTPGCSGRAVALCDWPLSGPKAGKTCSRAMCAQCRRPQEPEVDYCRTHHDQAKATSTPR